MLLPDTYTKPMVILVFALLLIWAVGLSAEPQMRVNHVGGFSFPSGTYSAVYAMEGDTLAVYDYSVVNRTISFTRGAIAPDGAVTQIETVFSYEVPSAWGEIWEYPLFCEFKHGKLYTAFDTDVMFLVFFANAQGTNVHTFDRSNLQYIFATHIFDENSGYISACEYPNPRSWICSLDFSTHQMPLFYEAPAISNSGLYNFLSFEDEYLLAYQLNEVGAHLLIENGAIIQTLYDSNWAFNIVGYTDTQKLCGTHYYTLGSGNLDKDTRQNSRSIIAWVENNQLGNFTLDTGFESMPPDMILCAIPQSDSTFTCLFYDTPYTTSPYKNYRVSNHTLIEADFFPDLSAFSGFRGMYKMDEDYTVAITTIGAPVYRFVLVDNPLQNIRSYDITISDQNQYSGDFYHSERYLYWLYWNSNYTAQTAQIFRLELGSSTQDEAIPVPLASLDSFPNPFSSACTIKVDSRNLNSATLGIYNLRGQLVKSLHQGGLVSGINSFNWDGKDTHNQDVSSGIYLLKLDSTGAAVTKRISLVK